jgi:sodium-dependent dicarboxylate transporter 2/3/5
MVAVLLPVCWILLVFVAFRTRLELGPEATRAIHDRSRALGPLKGGEARVLVIFVGTALAWLLRDHKDLGSVSVPGLVDVLPGLTDASIAILCAVLLFVTPGRTGEGTIRPLLTWAEARRIPWDVLLLFGGGLSLAAAMDGTGVTEWLGGRLAGLAGAPSLVIYLGIAVTVLVLSELASNLAVAAMTMPIMVSLSQVTGEPVIMLMLVAGFAASTGFALPIATPPNAIVFGSGQVSVRDMARGGGLLDVVAVIVVTGVMLLFGRVVLGL